MKIKFNKFERVAGIFVLVAVLGSLAATAGIAIQKGWFSSKVSFSTKLKSADGIHSGTVMQMAGLRIGSVTNVELVSADEILVEFEVFEKFHSRIRSDSHIQVIRPFVIGEKVLDISIGSEDQQMIPVRSNIASIESFDIMDLMSGKKLGSFLGSLEGLVNNLKSLGEAFSDPKRTEAFVKMFDRLDPLVKNMNQMAMEVVTVTNIATRKKRLETIIDNLALLTKEIGVMMPAISKNAPSMGQQIPLLVNNLAILTEEFKKLTPAISVIAPELPRVSHRAVEALDETVVLLKALQKSFLLRGNVKDVKAEEKERMPANTSGETK